ncbi:MAG: hypothetical protein HXY23_11940 [Parvularculaceae bacterium]|jgi:hypothetical protein|nr:hypothetical protein [Parvularculaceae bacterium]
MSDDELARKQRRRRNIAIGLGVAGFVLIVYLVTILRMQANLAAGP